MYDYNNNNTPKFQYLQNLAVTKLFNLPYLKDINCPIKNMDSPSLIRVIEGLGTYFPIYCSELKQ